MTESCSDTALSTIVESHNTTIAQWQLNLSLTLLACYLTRNRTVHLIGEPVLTSHRLKLEDTFYI